jgi:ATP-binding cassette subfamily B protein
MAKQEVKASVIMSLPGPIVTLFLNIGLTLVVLVGARRVNDGATEPGVILAFLTYFNMILMGVMGLNRIFMMMSRVNASAGRIGEVIDLPEELTPVPEAELAAAPGDEALIFDHVTFNYDADSPEEAHGHTPGFRL